MKRRPITRTVHTLLGAVACGLLAACSGGGDGGSGGSGATGATGPVAPSITTTLLPVGDETLPYSATLTASGTGPLTWSLSGSLPQGLTFNPAGGTITGTPVAPATTPVSVTVTGPAGTSTKDYTLTIRANTHRVSVVSESLAESNGGSGDGTRLTNGVLQERSFDPGISGTGRFVVFDSAATNLVSGVLSNGKRHVYLHDRETGITELISVGPGNVPGDDDSFVAAVSDDGQLVAFDSFAANLIAADTNGARDVFLRNRTTGLTERISQGVQGAQGICPNPGEGCNSFGPAISADGKVIAFGSFSRLLQDDTDDGTDIYVLDRRGVPTLRRLSAGIGGAQANILNGSPVVSADGQFVAFASNASNLLAGDSADIVHDVFLFNLQTGTLRKVSIPAGGGAADGDSFGPSLSGNGRFVAFWSLAGNLLTGPAEGDNIADVFVADIQGAQPSIVKLSVSLALAAGNGDSRFPSISRDGRLVAYDSLATNLDVTTPDTNGVRDIVVADRSCTFDATQPCVVKRVSLHGNGGQSNGESRYPVISGDGRFVVYYSDGSSLVDGDTNGVRDTFVSRRP